MITATTMTWTIIHPVSKQSLSIFPKYPHDVRISVGGGALFPGEHPNPAMRARMGAPHPGLAAGQGKQVSQNWNRGKAGWVSPLKTDFYKM